ncbi:Hsp20/alpha crystallin family protein [candidate division KSB1 bacterium]|nr:Hsp20/alpha crystallin family protein [candidate division KSB1 bacterium]
MLVRWSPAIPSLFSELENTFLSDCAPRENVSTFVPRAEIIEGKEHFIVRAELPGVKKEAVKITLENNLLTLTGEKRFEDEKAEKTFHLRETRYGKFERRFRLSENLDRQNIKADYKDGVLEIVLPKTKETQSREIGINLN